MWTIVHIRRETCGGTWVSEVGVYDTEAALGCAKTRAHIALQTCRHSGYVIMDLDSTNASLGMLANGAKRQTFDVDIPFCIRDENETAGRARAVGQWSPAGKPGTTDDWSPMTYETYDCP